jgi:hypothetical protein
MANSRKPNQDYVANANKMNNKQYSDADLKAEIDASKKK